MLKIKINFSFIFLTIIFLLSEFLIPIQATTQLSNSQKSHYFYILPLGTSGGEFDQNLSSYLMTTTPSKNWIALDAGTLCSTIKKIPVELFKKFHITPEPGETYAESFFKQHITAYLISHAHLDHINGLVICSTIDSSSNIYGLNSTINYLRDYIFNWKIWPNFADEGKKPQLKKYHYIRVMPGISIAIPKTAITVTPFILDHGNDYPSTAFLLEANNHYLLYFGDTGSDYIERSTDISKVWRSITPLVRSHQLNAIMIEVSYPNNHPINLLFGHLTPNALLLELQELAILVNPQQPQLALNGLKIIVTHVKQGFSNKQNSQKILAELKQGNHLNVKFMMPKAEKLIDI